MDSVEIGQRVGIKTNEIVRDKKTGEPVLDRSGNVQPVPAKHFGKVIEVATPESIYLELEKSAEDAKQEEGLDPGMVAELAQNRKRVHFHVSELEEAEQLEEVPAIEVEPEPA